VAGVAQTRRLPRGPVTRRNVKQTGTEVRATSRLPNWSGETIDEIERKKFHKYDVLFLQFVDVI
jgi:hypothetical protein